ncbi:hypothetical protein FRC00_000187 [Tulasnella sp. 408]|nr:hypothetical protein FRC00_000187 [Tulasnella sp. 408]
MATITCTIAEMKLGLEEYLDQLLSDPPVTPAEEIRFCLTLNGTGDGSIILIFKKASWGNRGRISLCGEAVKILKKVAEFLAKTSATGEDTLGCICGCVERKAKETPNT